jgi:hypothetical protein
MKQSGLLLSLTALGLLSAVAGCSHQAPPAGSAAQVAHPNIGFAMPGPPAPAKAPDAPPAAPELLDRQDTPIVDALHGWSHSSPR